MGRGRREAPGIIAKFMGTIFKPDRQRQEERKARREAKKKKKDEQRKGSGGTPKLKSRIAHRRYASLMRRFGVRR